MSASRLIDALALGFCRVGVAGLAPRAPGTWGAAVAALLAPIWFLPLPFAGRMIVLGGIFFVGSVAATRAEELLGCKDPSQVVIDELLGMWIALLPFATPSIGLVAAAFLLFRLFDIWKPWPVGASENWMRGGYGVMLDDVLAGLMALICVAALHWLGVV